MMEEEGYSCDEEELEHYDALTSVSQNTVTSPGTTQWPQWSPPWDNQHQQHQEPHYYQHHQHQHHQDSYQEPHHQHQAGVNVLKHDDM